MSFISWLRNLQRFYRLGTTTRKSRRAARCEPAKRFRLHFEALEHRITPSFSPATSYAVGTNPLAVVSADFNNDGDLDLATANADAGTVSVLLGDGAGGFGPAIDSDFETGATWVSLTAADFNNDGHDDLAMFRSEYSGWFGYGVILLSNGDGTFGSPTYVGSNAGGNLGLAAGDFNNDGSSDLVVIGGDNYNYTDWGFVQVLLGNGQGGFAAAQPWWFPVYKVDLTVGDLNGDGNLDVVATDGDSGGSSGVAILGNGAGQFVAQYDFYTNLNRIGGVALGDLTGDGIPDLAVAGAGVNTLVGEGDGTFEGPTYYFANSDEQTGVAVADFNSDGQLDVVTSDLYTDTVSLMLGNGNGTLDFAGAFAVGSWTTGVGVGDFNGDGYPDVATANGGSNTVSVLLNVADDNSPWLRIHDVTVTEGNTGVAHANFVVTLSAASTETVTVSYGTADKTATAGSDYQAASGTLTFAPGEISKTVAVLVNGDREGEYSNESFFVNLSGATNSTVVDGQAVGTIVEDEPQITTNYSTTHSEGNTGQTPFDFAVNLSIAYDAPVTVNWTTADDTAVAGSDYLAASGTVTFAPGEISKPITILVNGDGIHEANETFYVNLSDATNSVIIYGFAAGTIVNDDLSVGIGGSATVVEGNSGTKNVTFTVTLSAASTETITVAYATGNGTASAGSDFQSTSGTLTFAPGQTSKTVTVQVIGDRLPEPNETFFVNLSSPTNATISNGQGTGTILDNEPRISITDFTKVEGKKGKTTQFTFTVTLSAAYDQPVTMSYRTVDSTAKTSDGDYKAKSGTLTFSPGQTSKTITIEVKGDDKKEADEAFYLDLFGNSSNSLFTKNRGLGTILNDD